MDTITDPVGFCFSVGHVSAKSVHEPACYSQNVITDSYIVPQCIVARRSLGALMALYEGNFLKLAGLAPMLLPERPAGALVAVSGSPHDLDLHLTVDAVTRYTLDLRLSYHFDDPAGCVADPDLRLRVYLDARMVEVLGWIHAPRHDTLRKLLNDSSRELDRRWSKNIMFGKWLDYLHDMGHGFRASAPAMS
ncbi:MAG: DUF1249 domain-containing protein [Gammaproteobacteria bacterium]